MAVQEYIGAIKVFAGSYAIRGYVFAQGQTLAINQYTALFSLYGTTYGGNGVSTFQLPNMQSVLPISMGNGSGLTPRVIGETGGVENVTVLTSNVPSHNHVFNATTATATTGTAGSTVQLGTSAGTETFYAPAGTAGLATLPLNVNALTIIGGNLPHNNIQPSIAITYLIALTGIFPSRN
jgi:microcystin-dependent protein